jgi:uncharacterized protein (TIGR03067 family)
MRNLRLKSMALVLVVVIGALTGCSRATESRRAVAQEVTRSDTREDGQRQSNLDGAWTVVASNWDDPKDKDRGKGLTCIVMGEKVVIKAPEEEKPIGGLIIKLDATRKPKTINVWSDESSFGKSNKDTLKEPPVLGIYELDGDILKICWVPLENRSRPKEFPRKRGGGVTVAVLKRERPADLARSDSRENELHLSDPQRNALKLIEEGRQTFRFDTFGDEEFWGDALQIHRALAGAKLGGVGEGVSPNTALAVGLKVDADALPADQVEQLKQNKVDLDDPATTVALLKLDAVLGVKGFVSEDGKLQSVGITCALCHSTVDGSFAPGIGQRLDGWPNRDLNVGQIIALAPNLKPLMDRLGIDESTLKTALTSWGPGKYDAQLLHDGKAFRPDGKTAATLLPPAFGLAGINLHTYTGWGSVTHWNAYVAVTQMRGKGTFVDPRLNNPEKFPVAVKTGDWNIRNDPDLVTAKLPALQAYQLSIFAPKPPTGSFDEAAAARGEIVFSGKADCQRCHVPPLFTEPGWSMHTAAEIGIDDFQAKRSPDEHYRTTPLAGLWTHMKGGFYHDGRFATLPEVINHYNEDFKLALTEHEVDDLAHYLKSL